MFLDLEGVGGSFKKCPSCKRMYRNYWLGYLHFWSKAPSFLFGSKFAALGKNYRERTQHTST